MTTYPILVERYRGDQALTIVCAKCHATEVIKADDIINDDVYVCPVAGCDGWAQMKYAEADHRCGGCGRLGFFEEALGFCCSRVCQLQAEYAKELATRKQSA